MNFKGWENIQSTLKPIEATGADVNRRVANEVAASIVVKELARLEESWINMAENAGVATVGLGK